MARRHWLGWLALPAAGAVMVGAPAATALAAPTDGGAPVPDQGHAAPAPTGVTDLQAAQAPIPEPAPADPEQDARTQAAIDEVASASGGFRTALVGSLGVLTNGVGSIPEVTVSAHPGDTSTAKQLGQIGEAANTATMMAGQGQMAEGLAQLAATANLGDAIGADVALTAGQLALGAVNQPVLNTPAVTTTAVHLLGTVIDLLTAANLFGGTKEFNPNDPQGAGGLGNVGNLTDSLGTPDSMAPTKLLGDLLRAIERDQANRAALQAADGTAWAQVSAPIAKAMTVATGQPVLVAAGDQLGYQAAGSVATPLPMPVRAGVVSTPDIASPTTVTPRLALVLGY